jgi:hypothetical protein
MKIRYSKWFVWLALAGAAALPGATALSAQPYAYDGSLRADIARDQRRLNEALRRGRSREAARIARDLARDRQALRRDYRHDWR